MYKQIAKLLIALLISIVAVQPVLAAQYARPDQTIRDDNWEDKNGDRNALHQSINEVSPNDGTDWIMSKVSREKAEMGLSTLTDPGTSSGHIIRIRVYSRDEKDHEFRVTLNENAGNDRITRQTFLTNDTQVWETFTYTLSASEANAITDYADLDIEIDNRDDRDAELRVTWFEFEVPSTGAPPTVISPTFSAVTDTTATLGANVSNNGGVSVTDRGIEWGTSPGNYNAPISSGSSGTGVFTQAVTGLPVGTTIYFRGWATNSIGTSYSSEASFTTFDLPVVTSPTFASVTSSTATLGGNVTSDGGTAVSDRGIEWGTSPGVYNPPLSSGSSGTGTFTQAVTGLPANTTIYFRVWASNSVGTGYSGEASFTTLAGVPNVDSPSFASVTKTSATLGGNVASDGGAAVTDRGIEWGTSPGAYNAPESSGSSGTGSFTQAVTGFTSGTTIYFRAWAANSIGTGYSSESTFTTLAEPGAQATNIVIEVVASRSLRFSWTPGTFGMGSIAIVRLQTTAQADPLDSTDYIADPDYTLAPQTSAGSQNFVIYKGTGSIVTVNGLNKNTTYTITVYAWDGAGALTDYLQANPAEYVQTTNGPAMHNSDNGADCGVCHGNHGNSGLVPRGTNQADVCKTCHNPLGAAASMSDIAIHVTPGHAADDVDCGSCHEVHRISAGSSNTTLSTHPITAVTDYNLGFVRTNVNKYVSTATADDAVNQTRGNDQAMEGGDATTSRGICQACHTATDYHRNNSAVAASQCHRGGSNDSCNGQPVICTDCHTHSGGFEASGGCIQCHSSTQGTPPNDRRAVATEFNRVSTHVGFTSLLDDDCTVCHKQSSTTPSHQHQDGFLTLHNTDDHAATGYQLLDHSDPLTSATEAAKLNTFCLTCHDIDGAQAELTPMSPFTDSLAPRDIATNWPPSSHAMSPVSCLGDGAFGCHGSGHGGEKLKLLATADTPATPTDFPEEEEGFCFNCHDGAPASSNIQAEFNKTYRHPVVNSEQSNGRTVECTDCHNPHEATASPGAPGAGTTLRLTTGPLEGVEGVNTAVATVNPATYEYEVCFRCHQTGTAATPRQFPNTNVLDEFVNSVSYHPVTKVGAVTNNADMPSLINGWQANSITACTNCHNNDTAGPNGPHGSDWPSLLEGRYDTADNTAYTQAKYASCFSCHSATNILGDDQNSFADHRKHIDGENTPCNICHDPHASDKPRLINFDTSVVSPSGGKIEFIWNGAGSGSCELVCHGKDHSPKSYP